MDIHRILNVLNDKEIKGVQLTKANGILKSTWLLYKRKKFFFYFEINQKIEFMYRYKYLEIDLIL